jgi:predicted nucleic acid-binding protein
MSTTPDAQAPVRRVLDTNIVLDLWVFDEPKAEALRLSLETGSTLWLATAAMREELARVLAYPQIAKRLTARALPADTVLAHFDRHAQLQPDAPKAPYACKDADDQKFIDLAVAHTAALHSKDAQVLCMKKRLERCGVTLNPVDGYVYAVPFVESDTEIFLKTIIPSRKATKQYRSQS